MKITLYIANHRFIVISLLLMLLLASCDQLGNIVDLPHAKGSGPGEEIPGERSTGIILVQNAKNLERNLPRICQLFWRGLR